MGIEYRIVELNSGKFALEKNLSVWGISPFGWGFVCVPHPEPGCSNLVKTFNTIEDAKQYFVNPMGVKRVVENLTSR